MSTPGYAHTTAAMRFLLMALAIAGTMTVGACQEACPAALLTGTIRAQAGDLVVIPDGGGLPETVIWPAGHSVRVDGAGLVLVNQFGSVVARDGDTVRIGGGETTRPGTWTACGQFEVG